MSTEIRNGLIVDIPNVDEPWDAGGIRALTGFPREVIRERARLEMLDPHGEVDAVAPLSGVRARWILLTMAEQDAQAKARRPRLVNQPRSTKDPRDLLDRLGADPHKSSGRVPCPAHGGTHLNLAWKLDRDKVLLKCWSHQCTFAEILAAVA